MGYFITTPFVDAYVRSRDKISKAKFESNLRSHGEVWGGSGFWQALKKIGGLPKDVVGRPVLAFGTRDGQNFAAVYSMSEKAVYNIEVVKCGEFPDGWDVT